MNVNAHEVWLRETAEIPLGDRRKTAGRQTQDCWETAARLLGGRRERHTRHRVGERRETGTRLKRGGGGGGGLPSTHTMC